MLVLPSATSLILEALRIIPIPDVMSSFFQELQVCTHGTTGYAPWLLNPQPPSQYFRNEFLFNILHCGIWADQCLLRMRMWTQSPADPSTKGAIAWKSPQILFNVPFSSSMVLWVLDKVCSVNFRPWGNNEGVLEMAVSLRQGSPRRSKIGRCSMAMNHKLKTFRVKTSQKYPKWERRDWEQIRVCPLCKMALATSHLPITAIECQPTVADLLIFFFSREIWNFKFQKKKKKQSWLLILVFFESPMKTNTTCLLDCSRD